MTKWTASRTPFHKEDMPPAIGALDHDFCYVFQIFFLDAAEIGYFLQKLQSLNHHAHP